MADALSLPETSVEIIGDIGEITGAPVIAQLDDLDGDFPISVALFVRGETPAGLVGSVSRALRLRALVTDESPNPFTWLLVHPDGRVEPVTIDPEALDLGEFRIARRIDSQAVAPRAASSQPRRPTRCSAAAGPQLPCG